MYWSEPVWLRVRQDVQADGIVQQFNASLTLSNYWILINLSRETVFCCPA